jgi:uncharacterized protein YyaL (SSP411 family)
MDDAMPAGNGIAAQVLLRLGHLLGEARYLQAAENTLRAAWHDMQQLPHAHNALLTALEEYHYPPEIIVLRGGKHELGDWCEQIQKDYAPNRLLLAIEHDAADLPSALAAYAVPTQGVAAYLCRAGQCLAPVSTPRALQELLAK